MGLTRRFEAEASGGVKIDLLVAAEPIERGNVTVIPASMVFAGGAQFASLAYVAARVDSAGTLGIHAAAMGGTWQALVFGFLGVRFTEAGPQPDAHAAERLPSGWERVELALAYRGRTHAVKVART